ncbi:hypothetical protein [Polluticoccus soli]|uniref:hypothetical protein n=1 Tax=Polluticoccus soli TaxID=3034150 RepID=UPI0023E2D6A8|nr:hypothetical protein [Flavipsychrobacter sp. JY13-12]
MQWFLWLLALLISAAAGYWVYRADVKRAVPYPWLTALLRSMVILLTLLLLIAPVITITRNDTQKPIIVLLQDESQSIAHNLGKDTTTYTKAAQGLAEKLSDDYRVVTWGFGGSVQTDSLFRFRQQATDISTAMARVQEFYGGQNLGAVILASDGRFNQGSNPLYQQTTLRSPLYTVGIGDTALQKDIRIAQVFSNKTVALNSQFEIRADIVATRSNGYSNNVTLSEAGSTVGTSAFTVASNRYDRSVSFTVRADKPGLHHYIVNIPAADGEQNTANNRRDVFVEVVDEKKNILIVAAAPHPDINAIREALAGMESYSVTVRMADELPASYSEYDVLILHQIPSVSTGFGNLRDIDKPMWYILGSQSNYSQLNQMGLPANIPMNPGALRNVFAVYNTSFNVFTLPQTLNSVMDKMPPLNVSNGTVQPQPDVNIMMQTKNGDNMPLWMLKQGKSPVAILAGEGIWRWRLYEYKNFNTHNVIDELIRQTVSFLSVNSNDKPFQVQLPKYVWSDQETISLNAYLLNANNEQVNTPDVQLNITDSSGRKQNFSFERAGSAYKLNIGIWAGGTYNYTATTSYNGKPYNVSGSFVVESMPLELMQTGADYPLLYGMSKKYGGSFVPAANIGSLADSIKKNGNIKPVIQTNVDTVPLVDWKWYFFLLLAFAVAEWLMRKYWLAQ